MTDTPDAMQTAWLEDAICYGGMALFFVGIVLFVAAVIGRGAAQERRALAAFGRWAAWRGLSPVPTKVFFAEEHTGAIGDARVRVSSSDVVTAGSSSPDPRIGISVRARRHARALVLGPRATRDEREHAAGLETLTVAGLPEGCTLHASRTPSWFDEGLCARLRALPCLVYAGSWDDEVEVRLEGRLQPDAALSSALDLALAMARAPDDSGPLPESSGSGHRAPA